MATEYLFQEVPVYDRLGVNLMLARGARIDALDLAVDVTAPNLKQSGQPVSYVTSDQLGRATFTSTAGFVRLRSARGFEQIVYSPEYLAANITASVSAAVAADAAARTALSVESHVKLDTDGVPYFDGSSESSLPMVHDMVNAKDYGARGDRTVDDRAALQTALDAAAGKVIVVPAGDYNLSSGVNISAGTTVFAYGATFHRAGASASLVTNYPGGDTTTTAYGGRSRIRVFGLTLDSHGDDVNARVANLMTFNHAADFIVRDCRFLRTKGIHALELNSIDGALVERCRFEGYVSDPAFTNKEAIQLDCALPGSVGSGATDGTMARNISVRDCWFGGDAFGNGAHQVAVGSHAVNPGFFYENVLVTGCVSEGILTRMVQAYYWRNARISDCLAIAPGNQAFRSEFCEDIRFVNSGVRFAAGVGASGFALSTGTVRGKVLGCSVAGGTESYTVTSASACTVQGNTSRRPSSYGVVANDASDTLISGNLIDGAGYTTGANSAIRVSNATGPCFRTSISGNRVLLHGAGTEVLAGVSVASTSTDTWVHGNDFLGLAAATTGTVTTTSNRI